MAITSSAKKAHRVSLRKRVYNLRRTHALKAITKTFEKAPAADKLALAYKTIDKAAKRHVISKNAAARQKARLARLLKPAK